MAATRTIAGAAGALVACSLWSAPARADGGLTAFAGEDGAVDVERQCDVYIEGVATHAGPDPLRYRWLDGAAPLSPWADVRADGTAPVELCGLSPGRHALTLEVTDGRATARDTLFATILPDAPPSLAASSAAAPEPR